VIDPVEERAALGGRIWASASSPASAKGGATAASRQRNADQQVTLWNRRLARANDIRLRQAPLAPPA
jgi:hypothetical protein